MLVVVQVELIQLGLVLVGKLAQVLLVQVVAVREVLAQEARLDLPIQEAVEVAQGIKIQAHILVVQAALA
jgi:hypothetical protein